MASFSTHLRALSLALSLTLGTAGVASADSDMVPVDPKDEPYVNFASGDNGVTTVYLNRWGGLYLPGSNDSVINTSSLIDEPKLLLPTVLDDQIWTEVVSCVQDQFSQFRVDITDKDPGSALHIEAVVAGHPSDIDRPDHIGGLSPFRLDCGVLPSAVVFTFAEVYGNDSQRLCEITSHEIAHAFGLDHQRNCDDPLSYLGGCGDKHFRNQEARCGEYEDRECACGEETQNSLKLLTERLGDAAPPEPNIMSPAPGQSVNPKFYVEVSALDNVGVERLELYLDGELIGTRNGDVAVFESPDGVAAGSHRLELRAYDGENENTSVIDFQADPTVPAEPAPDMPVAAPPSPSGGCQSGPGTSGPWSAVVLLGLCSALARVGRKPMKIEH